MMIASDWQKHVFVFQFSQPCKSSLDGRDASTEPGMIGDSEFLDGGPV